MDDRRDPPTEPGSHPPIASRSRLSPVQEAWGAYVGHATHCQICRSLDAGRCELAEALHGTYEQLSDAAYRQLHPGRP